MKKTISILALALSVCLVSCKKQQGEPGAKGDPGTNGTNGAANISSFVFTTNTNLWTADNVNKLYYYEYSNAAITNQVLNSGAVMVYLGDGSGTGWIALPFSTQGVEFTYGFTSGKVEIDVTLSDGTMPNNPGGQQFRVVVIPPGMVKPGVNTKNYSEVKTAYNIE